jgi:hypothetical protein
VTMNDSELGELRAEMRQLQRDMATIKEHVSEMRDLLAQARGAQRAVLILGGCVATVASGAAWAWGFVKGQG